MQQRRQKSVQQIGKLSACICTKIVSEKRRVGSSKEDTAECGKLHTHVEG